ncbi:LacI family DNA-binding transcriptional regulator [Cohaesibacter celericrescens]|uniref:LacI family transcriptional regulator n=1 Tax=Cohaesibacter celericrescens TaxID=2067669 RepID=A0A2N5XNI2_9HYPH|nr:LacI family DNA-binding transcriptional regulator [Cohaesibacter celericrescens]PLW76079.1 LacI family transcriptional regulator [Cohaesibacter celericrescens]
MKKQVTTLAEVAKVAGVSRMTASRAMNNQPGVSVHTREAILRIADEMGYVANPLAQKLSAGQTRLLGVVVQLHTPFAADLVLGIGSAARGAGYEMLAYSLPSDNTEKANIGNVVSLLQQITDGVIAILPSEGEYLDKLMQSSVPVVTVDTITDEGMFPSVAADSYQGGRLAVSHLAELGHKRIGFISGNQRLTSARARKQAYCDLIAQLNLDQDPDLLIEGDYSQKSGFEAAKKLLALPERPTAIFASNDMGAFGAMTAIRENGLRIPQDISIVGFDDVPLAHQTHPPLTTVHQPLQEMGRAAVNMLIPLILGLDLPSRQTVLSTNLVVRESTAQLKT